MARDQTIKVKVIDYPLENVVIGVHNKISEGGILYLRKMTLILQINMKTIKKIYSEILHYFKYFD